MDKFLTNYQQNILYYVVVDDEGDVYMKFTNYADAIVFYDDMLHIYRNTPKVFHLTKIEHTVLQTNEFTIGADEVAWFD